MYAIIICSVNIFYYSISDINLLLKRFIIRNCDKSDTLNVFLVIIRIIILNMGSE